VELTWAAGGVITRSLDGSDSNDPLNYPRVRYLSQQFVEDLCSSHGLSDALLQEMERVIFEAHPINNRDGSIDFGELLDRRATRFRLARDREAEALEQLSERIGTELEKERLVGSYDAQVNQKAKQIANYTADRAKLVSKGSEERVARHTAIATAAEKVRAKIRAFANQRQTFVALQDEVDDLRRNKAPETLRQTQARHPASGMSQEQWSAFLLDYKGDVDQALAGYKVWAENKIGGLKGEPPLPGNDHTPYIADHTDLDTLPLALLEAEMSRLEKLVSTDKQIQRYYAILTNRITLESAALETLKEKLTDARGAKERAQQLQRDREAAYQRAFEAIIAEQDVLEQLYAPLMERLTNASGTLRKLSFSVARVADVGKWAEEAEEDLIDLRIQGPFRGRGTLLQRANEVLRPAWETGSAADVQTAMREFQRHYLNAILQHSPVPRTEHTEFRAWSKRFARWLFGTDHIEIRYGITYDGVDIRNLSPGTRGIVLLLLYLSLDDGDDRPLIIDQPEENLDPKSVFDELVDLFV
jgi:hypothetical protein